jgi:hypothetical protein
MQPALQMSSSPRVKTSTHTRKVNWNKPDITVQLTGKHLVEMFLALSSSLIVDGNTFALTRVEDIPEAIKHHTRFANLYRDVTTSPVPGAESIQQYFRHAQMAALLKKVEFPLFEDACASNALEKWFAAEEGCKEMNRICMEILNHAHSNKHPELAALFVGLRAEILALVGAKPPADEALANGCGFGPGADASHVRSEGHAAFKQLGHSVLTEHDIVALEDTAPSLLATGGDPLRAMVSGVQSVCASYCEARLEFVPKSCEEHRTIEIMPSLSTYRAKGVDAFFRRQLRDVWGIDLSDQMPNRHLAFLGSLRDDDDSPVTLDLSSASDRISMGVIRLLFPVEWCKLLFGLRAKTVRMPDGSLLELQKFSSMGNSITFSLQTIIYSAIILHTYKGAGLRWKKWRAYGDDLIVLKRAAPAVIKALELLGFKLNHDKSFTSGPFRESCGHDYFSGQNVRPFYIKKPIRSVCDINKYVNVMQSVAVRSPIPASAYRGLFSYLLQLIPKESFLVGHPAYGVEACLWSPYSVVPSKILMERAVLTRIPEYIGYRVALLNGAGDSVVQLRKTARKVVDLRKEPTHFTPSTLKAWIEHTRLLESAATLEVVGVRDVREAPTGVTAVVLRRPGKPGLSPLSEDEVSKLLDPILARC